MNDITHKEEFEKDKNKILIGFIFVLLAFFLIVVKIKLIGNEEKPVKSQVIPKELFATWYQAHCVQYDSLQSSKD